MARVQTFVATKKELKIIHYLIQNLLPTASRDLKAIIPLLCMKHRLYVREGRRVPVFREGGLRMAFCSKAEETGGGRKWLKVGENCILRAS